MIWGTWYTSGSFNPDTSAFTQRLNFPINHNLQSHACIHIQFHLKNFQVFFPTSKSDVWARGQNLNGRFRWLWKPAVKFDCWRPIIADTQLLLTLTPTWSKGLIWSESWENISASWVCLLTCPSGSETWFFIQSFFSIYISSCFNVMLHDQKAEKKYFCKLGLFVDMFSPSGSENWFFMQSFCSWHLELV